MRRAVASMVAVLCLAASCGGSTAAPVKLDGSPRVPDDEGVVTAVTREELTLDGERSYAVSDDLRSFSTYTLELEPMLSREGQYVHVGIDDGEVVWMAGIAAVVPGEKPAVYYTGDVVRMDDGRLVMRDGTVLRLPDGHPKVPPGAATLRIDPARHLVVEVRSQAG